MDIRRRYFSRTMKLHLFGAAGSGVTTLGHALSEALAWPYFDTDDYFWLPTIPAFTDRRPAAERNAQLRADLQAHPRAIVGGSIGGWGDEWFGAFDFVVFLWLPPALRLQRLHEREYQRYDQTDPAQVARTQAFLTWAAGYDTNSTGGSRTLANHTAWLTRFICPVLELRGDLSVAQRMNAVLAALPNGSAESRH
jgi:adenylate kinase family enzyme